MFKKLTSSILAAAVGVLLATNVSSAATFDFVAIADGPPVKEEGGQPLNFSDEGINLQAFGFVGGQDAFAYLDHSWDVINHRAPGGLGVCGSIDQDLECDPAWDDNVTTDESLKLVFDREVTLSVSAFNNHNIVVAGLVDFSVDGGAFVALEMSNLANFASHLGTMFEFRYNDAEFYLGGVQVSAVPLPPAVLLFGAALFGLGWLGRRRKIV